MRIYTRKGDKGETSLISGQRVSKTDLRVESYGTCDELNSVIGLALSYANEKEWAGKDAFLVQMQRVQTVLFHVGAELATPDDKKVMWTLRQEHIDELENQMDEWDKQLDKLRQFILPSGTLASSTLHMARTVTRRAERNVIKLDEEEPVNPLVISYLNRLSDFLFVAARYVNKQLGGEERLLKTDM